MDRRLVVEASVWDFEPLSLGTHKQWRRLCSSPVHLLQAARQHVLPAAASPQLACQAERLSATTNGKVVLASGKAAFSAAVGDHVDRACVLATER